MEIAKVGEDLSYDKNMRLAGREFQKRWEELRKDQSKKYA